MKTAPMKFLLVTSCALVASMLVSVATRAQGTSQERSACMGDAFRFCSADIPNVTKIEACLSQNRNSLTPACAAEFQPSQSTKLKPEHFRKD
jgi:hypothetical protein